MFKDLIDYLRANSHGCYATSMTPPITQTVIIAMSMIMGKKHGEEGKKQIIQLASNVKYFRRKLKALGCVVYGNDDSPIIPMLVYLISKVGYVYIVILNSTQNILFCYTLTFDILFQGYSSSIQ